MLGGGDPNEIDKMIGAKLYDAAKIHKTLSYFASNHTQKDLTDEENGVFEYLTREIMEQIKIISELKQNSSKVITNRLKKTFKLAHPDFNDEEIDNCVYDATYNGIMPEQILLNQMLNNTGTDNAKLALLFAREQQNELHQIEKAIAELYQMSIDINHLIQAQGEMLDSLEIQLSQCNKYSSKGLQMLQVAEDAKISSRKKKIITGVIIAVVAGIVILTIAGVAAGVLCLCT